MTKLKDSFPLAFTPACYAKLLHSAVVDNAGNPNAAAAGELALANYTKLSEQRQADVWWQLLEKLVEPSLFIIQRHGVAANKVLAGVAQTERNFLNLFGLFDELLTTRTQAEKDAQQFVAAIQRRATDAQVWEKMARMLDGHNIHLRNTGGLLGEAGKTPVTPAEQQQAELVANAMSNLCHLALFLHDMASGDESMPNAGSALVSVAKGFFPEDERPFNVKKAEGVETLRSHLVHLVG
ncbi:MAG: hypothetical protein WAX89_04690 [Alphaproteobacteria bacterium]